MASGDARRHAIVVRLNQQQMEMVDRTVAGRQADSREALLRRAEGMCRTAWGQGA
ncbi:hypothetical protein [uncultured Roseibium sp.]|uniref:hypothetical protein n=1 Tax=uncultured Roseibium sp. TaxID=1936171 RepID=UPI0026355334|nr:hypothetical protein [uncultured Roseibium sp.]